MKIKSAYDLLSIEPQDFDLEKLDFSELLPSTIKLDGRNLDASITFPMMTAYEEYQKSIYRLYAIVAYGSTDINISKSEKKSLEISIQLGKGSSRFTNIACRAIVSMFTEALRNMDSKDKKQVLVTMIVCLLGFGGAYLYAGLRSETNSENNETKRLMAVTELAAKQIDMVEALAEFNNGSRAILRGAVSANSVELDDKPVTHEMIEAALQDSPVPSEIVRLDATYRLTQFNNSQENQYTVKLTNIESGFSFTAQLDSLTFHSLKDEIQSAVFDRKSVALQVNATMKNARVHHAFIVSMR